MADTTVQREVEEWVRECWLPRIHDQKFDRRKVRLSTGGEFTFGAVSEDLSVVAMLSTSQYHTASGKGGDGKVTKIRADYLYLMLAEVELKCMLFTEADMYEHMVKEQDEHRRIPGEIDLVRVRLPEALASRLSEARTKASQEGLHRDPELASA